MRSRIGYAILFALAFAGISWMAPAAYYTMAPAESIVAIEDVGVEVEGNTTHNLTAEYDSAGRFPVEARTTLYRAEDQSDAVVQSWRHEGFLTEGGERVSLELSIDEPLPPGGYYYEIEVTYHPGYNVERTTTATTSTFSLPPANETNSTTGTATAAIIEPDLDAGLDDADADPHPHPHAHTAHNGHASDSRSIDRERRGIRDRVVRPCEGTRR